MQYMQSVDKNTCYMYCSLHFRDEIVGYVILRNPEFLYDHPEQFDIQSALLKRLENLLSKRYLRIQIMSLRISTTMMRSQAYTIVWHAMRWSFLCLLSLKLKMSAAP